VRRPGISGWLTASALPWQLTIVLALLAAWQYLPAVPGLAKTSAIFDPFFVSSPERIWKTIYRLAAAGDGPTGIWVPFVNSMGPVLVGTGSALVAGSVAGLICSNWRFLNRIVRPFVVTMNALPRITLIPIFVIVVGPNATADLAVGFLVVFFLVFFNAYEGGISVPDEMLESARILGAGQFEQLRRIRLPYVLVWVFAQLPNAIAFGLTTIITTELFTGSNGLGRLLLVAVDTANADLTFAVAVVLALTGLTLVGIAGLVRGRILHWW
jgi:NitT/TauT family transport system permease protein